jgi:hypothetical protein
MWERGWREEKRMNDSNSRENVNKDYALKTIPFSLSLIFHVKKERKHIFN